MIVCITRRRFKFATNTVSGVLQSPRPETLMTSTWNARNDCTNAIRPSGLLTINAKRAGNLLLPTGHCSGVVRGVSRTGREGRRIRKASGLYPTLSGEGNDDKKEPTNRDCYGRLRSEDRRN